MENQKPLTLDELCPEAAVNYARIMTQAQQIAMHYFQTEEGKENYDGEPMIDFLVAIQDIKDLFLYCADLVEDELYTMVAQVKTRSK